MQTFLAGLACQVVQIQKSIDRFILTQIYQNYNDNFQTLSHITFTPV